MAQGINLNVNGLLTGAREIESPVMNGLTGWWYTRNSPEEAVINYAPGGLPGAIIGAPDFASPGLMKIDTNVAYMRLPVVETAALTWIIAFQNDDTLADTAHQPMLMNTHNGSSGISLWLSNHATGPLPQARGRGVVWTTANQVLTVNLANVGSLRALALRVSGSAASIRELVEGVANPITMTGARTATGRPITIGGYFSSAFGGTARIACAATYDRALSDVELGDTLAFMLNDLAYEGVGTA